MSLTRESESPPTSSIPPVDLSEPNLPAAVPAIDPFLLAHSDGVSLKRKRSNNDDVDDHVAEQQDSDEAPSSPRKVRRGAFSSGARVLQAHTGQEGGGIRVSPPIFEDVKQEPAETTYPSSLFGPSSQVSFATTPPSSPPIPPPSTTSDQIICPNCGRLGHAANDTWLCPLLIDDEEAAVVEQFPRHLRNAKRDRRLFRIETEAREHSFHGGDPELNEMLKTRYEQEWERKLKLRRRGGFL